MEFFLSQKGLNMISVLLVLGAVGCAVWFWFKAKIEEEDAAAAKAEALADAPRYVVHPGHAADLLGRMESLHRPLAQHRNPTMPGEALDEVLAHMGVSARDRNDIINGTKLS